MPMQRWDDIIGEFAMLVCKGGALHVLTDYFGAFQLFHDTERAILSTSLLSLLGCLPRVRFSAQGVYEFAFSAFPMGDETPFAEVRRLGPFEQLTLDRGTRFHAVAKPLPQDSDDRPVAEQIADHAERLTNLAATAVRHYGDAIQCPLSGGYDSRLLLGLLQAAGARPHVYVYGQAGDRDVEIARTIGAGEGFDVELFDKAAFARPDPDAFADTVARNFHEVDALVTDGGLFDNGGNRAARLARQAGGAIAASGGCGEIYRNFFYLPNRGFSVRELLAAFFSQFDPADAGPAFDADDYYQQLAGKLRAALGTNAVRLTRQQVEAAYPLFRCRPFFGREISIVGRHGGYFMPFLNAGIVAAATRIPVQAKALGRFQAALISAIAPALARYPSNYGHSFAGPPTARRWLGEAGGALRPPWLRQRSYRLRKRLGRIPDDHGGLLTPDYLGRVMDPSLPLMQRYFNLQSLRDVGMLRRIANLEYLGQWLGSRLVTDGKRPGI